MVEQLTWKEIENLVDTLAYKISLSKPLPKYIIGLQRGGLIPAVLLSHKLNIPLGNIKENHYQNSKTILVVDDIADTGETLKNYSKYPTAVLHYKPQSIHIPTFYANLVDNDEWIIFPWENKDSEHIQDYLK
jgi:hypoxanthine phosphoribosyltransferase